jgi:hypothetical protein
MFSSHCLATQIHYVGWIMVSQFEFRFSAKVAGDLLKAEEHTLSPSLLHFQWNLHFKGQGDDKAHPAEIN